MGLLKVGNARSFFGPGPSLTVRSTVPLCSSVRAAGVCAITWPRVKPVDCAFAGGAGHGLVADGVVVSCAERPGATVQQDGDVPARRFARDGEVRAAVAVQVADRQGAGAGTDAVVVPRREASATQVQ